MLDVHLLKLLVFSVSWQLWRKNKKKRQSQLEGKLEKQFQTQRISNQICVCVRVCRCEGRRCEPIKKIISQLEFNHK